MLRIIGNASVDSHTSGIFADLGIIKIHHFYNFRISSSYITRTQLPDLTTTIPAYVRHHSDILKMVNYRTNYGMQILNSTLPNVLNNRYYANEDSEKISGKELRNVFLLDYLGAEFLLFIFSSAV